MAHAVKVYRNRVKVKAVKFAPAGKKNHFLQKVYQKVIFPVKNGTKGYRFQPWGGASPQQTS